MENENLPKSNELTKSQKNILYKKKNADKIKEYNDNMRWYYNAKYTCDICFGSYTRKHISEHYKTKKHRDCVTNNAT